MSGKKDYEGREVPGLTEPSRPEDEDEDEDEEEEGRGE
jgi:hypothetical protein